MSGAPSKRPSLIQKQMKGYKQIEDEGASTSDAAGLVGMIQ
eukprot:CAMPEP_0197494296 /NCGR_PEP_ID=MMETSP1311-20131121/28789_1 /TAXON_ID=464262 /ORGANISM="Genus nov. species nov., Strain RCC856" /LENGTH=40 /DNA_ID= /DNA_START= /DNA_END= /DNA_ORIENTATION=